MTANKQYHFQVTKIVFFAKHILTTGFIKALVSNFTFWSTFWEHDTQ